MSGLNVREVLEGVVNLTLLGETTAAAALLDGQTTDPEVVILAAAPGLFATYLSAADFERAGCVASLAIAAHARRTATT